jgi:hypothetical protein
MCTRLVRLPDIGEVPCGKCPDCRKKYVNDWVYRLASEYKNSEASYFCTLTFDENHFPPTKEATVRAHQLFMKRLRKKFGKFRFFSVLEYGPTTGRPHFHILLFTDTRLDQDKLFLSWQNGFVSIEPLRSEAGIRYTAKYLNKDQYKSVMLCSRRPFIGKHALEKNLESFIENAQRSKGPLPRIYKKKLRGIEEFENAKAALIEKYKVDFRTKYALNTPLFLQENEQREKNIVNSQK